MTSILTGYIINSRSVASKEWLPLVKTTFKTVGETPKTWEIFRGDSFQIEINKPENALLFAIELKTVLKKFKNLDVRIAIGIGSKKDDYTNITEGSGEAFINSGKAFDNLVKKQNLAIISPWQEIDNIFNTAFAIALLTIDNWTVNSADFVAMCLKKPNTTQKLIAKELNISESSASERRKRAGFDEIMQLEKLYRELITKKTNT